jgi:hypothetical protein
MSRRLRVSGQRVGLRRQLLTNEAFDLIPKVRVALALHVVRRYSAIEPRHAITLHGILVIIEAVVAQDLSFGIVGGMNFAASVQNSMWLVEIGGLDDIVGNDAVVLPGFCDRIDLDG